jgi:hypothetical protein
MLASSAARLILSLDSWSCSCRTSSPQFISDFNKKKCLEAHKVLTYIEYRAVSGVFQTIDPSTPSPPRECVLPPHQRRGGVNISEDARHWIGLLKYNPSTPRIHWIRIRTRIRIQHFKLIRIWIQGFDGQKLKKLQEKPSALKREHSALQKMKL